VRNKISYSLSLAHFVLILVLLFSSATTIQAQITYIGEANTPADNGNSNTTPQAVTPPGSMQAGDLVLLFAHNRNAGTGYTISNTGGQVWNTLQPVISNATAAISSKLFWCKYNGTWAANPSVAFSASSGNTVVMFVFRPTKPSLRWSIEEDRATANFTAPTTPFTVSITGRNTRVPSSVTIAAWFSNDNNDWVSLAGAGWNVLGEAQYRNSNGTGNSSSYAYQIRSTVGATNNVSKNIGTTVGSDPGSTFIITFYEMAYGMASLSDF
jgi:hypothetical protein